jgi:hypothetical protein
MRRRYSLLAMRGCVEAPLLPEAAEVPAGRRRGQPQSAVMAEQRQAPYVHLQTRFFLLTFL